MHTRTGRAKASVRFRTAQFRRLAEAKGHRTDMELASLTGLDRTTMFRLMKGEIAPGERIIANVLLAFPDRRFEDFFEVAEGSPTTRRRTQKAA